MLPCTQSTSLSRIKTSNKGPNLSNLKHRSQIHGMFPILLLRPPRPSPSTEHRSLSPLQRPTPFSSAPVSTFPQYRYHLSPLSVSEERRTGILNSNEVSPSSLYPLWSTAPIGIRQTSQRNLLISRHARGPMTKPSYLCLHPRRVYLFHRHLDNLSPSRPC